MENIFKVAKYEKTDEGFNHLGYIGTFYSKLIVRNVKNYLIGINKEKNRNKITKFELI
jgi:hypothetical protein